MIKLKYVEDFIEALVGVDTGNKLVGKNLHFKLARYDVNIINSFAETTLRGIALTDRQGSLAIKLALTYKKQLAKQNISVESLANPVFRIALRVPDRSRSIALDNNKILVKFPYNPALIKTFQEFSYSKSVNGQYDATAREWRLPITEEVVNWIVTWGEIHHFIIDSKLKEWYNEIIRMEGIPYKIQLVETDTALAIEHAAPDLIQYLANNNIALSYEYINDLVKLSGLLGYSVSSTCLARASKALVPFAAKHSIHVTNDINNLAAVRDFAEATDTYPIYIFDPLNELGYRGRPTTETLTMLEINADEVEYIQQNGKKISCKDPTNRVKLVYASAIPKQWKEPIPLLISTVEILHNGNRQRWRALAEHLVYYTAAVLHKDINGNSDTNNQGRG